MKKKYKILAISHAFIKKINLSFYNNLAKKKNFNLTCVYPEKIFLNGKIIIPDFKKKKNHIKLFKLKLSYKHSRIFYFKNIKKIIIDIKPEYVVLDNDPISLQSLILIYYSNIYNYKILYFCNENNLINIFKKFSIKKLFKIILLYIMNLFIKNKITKIFCYSKQIKSNYDFLGYKSKTILMPLGFDERIFRLPKIKKDKKKIVIAYFGRIIKDKGIHLIIDALNNIKFNSWEFMIDVDFIEDQKYFDDLMNKFKKLFKKNIIQIRANHYNISKYMQKSDIVILPSIYEEQYGRVLQEAVACGNVVIGSNVGAIPEIIDDPELIFDVGDYFKLSKIIENLSNRNYFDKKYKKLYKKIIPYRTVKNQIKIFEKTISLL